MPTAQYVEEDISAVWYETRTFKYFMHTASNREYVSAKELY